MKWKCHLAAMSKTVIYIHKYNTCAQTLHDVFFTFGETVRQKMSTSKPVHLMGFLKPQESATQESAPKKPKCLLLHLMRTGDTEKLRATGVKVNTFCNLKYYIMHGLFYLFLYFI